MKRMLLSIVASLLFCAPVQAEQLSVIKDGIFKVLSGGNLTEGQISFVDNPNWVLIKTQTPAELDRILRYFSKAKASGETVTVYVRGETFVGAVCEKYGRIGQPPEDRSGPREYVGVFQGCDFNHGILECGVMVNGRGVYFNSENSPKVTATIKPDRFIGKKVKVVGAPDQEIDSYIHATSITLAR